MTSAGFFVLDHTAGRNRSQKSDAGKEEINPERRSDETMAYVKCSEYGSEIIQNMG